VHEIQLPFVQQLQLSFVQQLKLPFVQWSYSYSSFAATCCFLSVCNGSTKTFSSLLMSEPLFGCNDQNMLLAVTTISMDMYGFSVNIYHYICQPASHLEPVNVNVLKSLFGWGGFNKIAMPCPAWLVHVMCWCLSDQ